MYISKSETQRLVVRLSDAERTAKVTGDYTIGIGIGFDPDLVHYWQYYLIMWKTKGSGLV